MERTIIGLFAFVCMLILMLDGKVAFQGASEGVQLCIRTVIPSMFPYFFLTSIITDAFMGTRLNVLRPIAKFCSLPAGMEHFLICSYFGGYPTAAQTISQATQRGDIPSKEAERLLAFFNNAGPSFIFGVCGVMFSSLWAPWFLWAVHILASFCCAALFPAEVHYTIRKVDTNISGIKSLRSSIFAMTSVCGWIILFRILISFLRKWILWILPAWIQVLVVGILELSNGCTELMAVSNEKIRFIMCASMLSLGGLCVVMQIVSVTNGLSLKYFFFGIGIRTIMSLLISIALMYRKEAGWCIILPFVALFLGKYGKRGSIPAKAGV